MEGSYPSLSLGSVPQESGPCGGHTSKPLGMDFDVHSVKYHRMPFFFSLQSFLLPEKFEAAGKNDLINAWGLWELNIT